jgi:hypothetical protein
MKSTLTRRETLRYFSVPDLYPLSLSEKHPTQKPDAAFAPLRINTAEGFATREKIDRERRVSRAWAITVFLFLILGGAVIVSVFF